VRRANVCRWIRAANLRGALLVGFAMAACSDGSPAGGPIEPNGCAAATLAHEDQPAQTGNVRHVHDPSIHRYGEYYYVYSTNDGIPIRRSRDLVHWEWVGRVFPNQVPSWAPGAVPGVEAPWAPDVVLIAGTYHLFYSLSTFGSQRSVIGRAVNETLDPDDPRYNWEDRGGILESWPGVSDHNAIDPTVVVDEGGEPWLAWGSWSGGIMIRRLDPETGMLSEADTVQHRIATRTPLFSENSIEGPYILRRGGYYYLFVSYDLCCRGNESTYNVRVGRSSSVTGPYLDRAGVRMTQGGGTPLLRGYGRIRGPGHGSVLDEGDRQFYVHHYYDAHDGGVPQLQIRRIYWDGDEWPHIGAPYSGSDPGSEPTAAELVGDWGYWVDSDSPTRITLRAEGTVERCDASGTCEFDSPELSIGWSTDRGVQESVTAIVSGDGRWLVGQRLQEPGLVRAYWIGAS
jgi:arabinan endo-1,5-alpha-L-arabinosidase